MIEKLRRNLGEKKRIEQPNFDGLRRLLITPIQFPSNVQIALTWFYVVLASNIHTHEQQEGTS